MKKLVLAVIVLVLVGGAVWYIFGRGPMPGRVKDEALVAGRAADSVPAADDTEYFREMDGGVQLTADESKGRNTWNVWSGGNDAMWDKLTDVSFGALDFLKILSTHPGTKFSRDNRWEHLGLVNNPCFTKADGPSKDRYGLWLDVRKSDCRPDPFEDEAKYPGVKIGARGKNMPVGSYYGYETGILGLRLFPNPAFDEAAAKAWDPEKYYTDKTYYERKDLIKPYRVGMSCGFCHIGPNPVNPPADPNNPTWANISSAVGSQYFWTDRIFFWSADESNFAFQVFHTYRPGTLDTSLISTDNINNPRTMNAVYLLGPRLEQARRWGKEQLTGGQLDNKQFNDFVSSGPFTQFFQKPDVWTPRVLKDGSDSVGAMGALNRVYLNIGTFSEEWLLHFNALVGGKRVTPIPIETARKNSAYFAATEAQTFNTALFFLKATGAHHLKDAPDGSKYMKATPPTVSRGLEVFAENCARCHSSKLPEMAPGLDPGGCAGKDYMDCWKRYWDYTKTSEFKQKMLAMVKQPDFLKDNYLSAEFRVPVTLLHTNACSPLATNALSGNIWDNFSSQSYKDLPSVGEIVWYHPITGEPKRYQMPAGGRGYTRPPSLVSLWSTAPFLLNNTVGRFEESGSVEARLRSFDDSIEKMLWPEKRDKDVLLGDKVPGMMDRTTKQSYLKISSGYLPPALNPLLGIVGRFFPTLAGDSGIQIGPLPKDMAIGLLANLNLLSEDPDPVRRADYEKKALPLFTKILGDLKELPPNATDEQARAVFRDAVDPLLEMSKCPDFVVNRGHYFGTGYLEPAEQADPALRAKALEDRGPGLSESDKRALIEFLKTL
jgi:hypothetical protein